MIRARTFRYTSALFSLATLAAACGGESSDPQNQDPGKMNPPASVMLDLRIENIAPWTYAKSGVFNTPIGKDTAGPIRAGDAYEVTFTAGRQHKLSFVTMFGASNDWFFGTVPEGIALYDENRMPISGDITSMLRLYDSGTELDEEPGVGASTGPKQPDPTAGAADPIARVRELTNPIALTAGGTFDMPPVSQILRATLSQTGVEREFKLRIENISTADTLMTSEGSKPVGASPGVFVLHTADNPLFTLGEADRGRGLEQIAEAGRVQTLADFAASSSGVATGFSPLVYVVHGASKPIYAMNAADRGMGLEPIAESGNVMILSDAFTAALPQGASAFAVVNTPENAAMPGAIRPGQAYDFNVEAKPGDRFSFASMFGASNDWLLATPEDGIALFDADGKALLGDHTAELLFVNAGTEIDQEAGVGAFTGGNQATPDSGDADAVNAVRALGADLYPRAVSEHVMFTITMGQPQ